MGNVTLFQYSGHQIRIVKEETGEPWFVAADICRCLGLAINKRTGKPNVTVATRNLGDDQKRKYRIDTPENPKNPWIDMMILSEDGLYKMLRISDSLDVQRFKLYVQREVLPQHVNGASAAKYASQG
ncbi:MAG: Bro-N domain-containing protein [Gammaproteobacteria bacterium]|nr:Bro-N domain-containing protein [Gammaproteobacteria bacterium]NNC68505.1 Bro-N domain-containing protein [Gammaproteobacteria bacterium]